VATAPLLVSPDDRLHHLTERAQDYVTLGVLETWILDPESKKAFIHRASGLTQVEPAVLRLGPLASMSRHCFPRFSIYA
jgi:Uma2 family endonuclease